MDSTDPKDWSNESSSKGSLVPYSDNDEFTGKETTLFDPSTIEILMSLLKWSLVRNLGKKVYFIL